MSNTITRQTTLQELLAIVSAHLAAHNISAVLTGGTVVSVYTDNKHESKDLDFISPSEHEELVKVMAKIDFKPVVPKSKDLGHAECPITIEFPGRTVILGGQHEKVEHTEIVEGVTVKMLSPTQSVQDRLAGFIAWKDPQNLEQAEWICERQPVNFEKIKKWAKKEGASDEQLEKIIERCERGIRKYVDSKKD